LEVNKFGLWQTTTMKIPKLAKTKSSHSRGK
jgi:hypothetical protein